MMLSYLKMKELKMREIEKVFTRKKRRAVSDIIATLLMVVITVAGGIVVLNFVQTTDIIQSTETISSEEAAISIKITGYDTRDSGDLSGILTMDNLLDQKLCTTSCSVDPDKIPANFGTEFIVLNIRNDGAGSAYLGSIFVNNIIHTWDSATGAGSGVDLDASSNPAGGSSPRDGQYSIIPTSNTLPITQEINTELKAGNDRRIVIKLSASIASDIDLSSAIRIIIDAGRADPFNFVISSGSTQ